MGDNNYNKKDKNTEVADMRNKTYKGPRLTKLHSDILWYAFPMGCTAVGLFYPNQETWFYALRDLFVFLTIQIMVFSAIWEFIVPFFAFPTFERIQSGKTQLPLYFEEVRDTILAKYVIATVAAWPLAMTRDGYDTAFKKTIGEAAYFDSYAYYGLKMLVTTFIADAFCYWKHYTFHHPAVYAIHKNHHAFHNPSTFAGFAIHPIEIWLTFAPSLLFCVPQINLYAPMHAPFLLSWYYLNLYMHCGYHIPILTKTLSFFWIDTSDWHNLHHATRVCNFSEMLVIWDYIMDTHSLKWDKKRIQETMDNCVKESNEHRGVATTKKD